MVIMNDRHGWRRGRFCGAGTGARIAAAGVALLAAASLQGCNNGPVASVPTTRYYAVDLQGAAKNCTVSSVVAQAGREVPAQMSVGSDGGWCALTIGAGGDIPYGAGLLTTRPEHGEVYIHTVGNTTRIDYTPTRGFVGSDKFSTTLLPGSAVIAFSVTVTPK